MSDDTQIQQNQIAAHQRLLYERLLFFLAKLQPYLRADVTIALEGTGKLLSLPQSKQFAAHSKLPAGHWPLLTMLVAEHCDHDIDPTYASTIAVAIECFICALDLLDDVEDGDQTATLQTLGEARTLNVSTTLLVLAQRIILSMSEQHVSLERILRLLDTLQEAALTATAGQHRDLLGEQQSALEITQEDCIEIARGKAGALIRLTCRLGALCAGAHDALCELLSELGELLGIAQQLDNDAHDLYYLLQDHPSQTVSTPTENIPRSVKTDLVRGKKTLPVVIAAQRNQSLQNAAVSADEMSEEQIQALHEGIIATWGVSLLYHERARERFQAIEAQHPIAPALRMLLNL
jgi:geranylgeranyl pyrophosphate synthase